MQPNVTYTQEQKEPYLEVRSLPDEVNPLQDEVNPLLKMVGWLLEKVISVPCQV